MKHEMMRLEQTAFWLHVFFALMLLLFMLRVKLPDLIGWLQEGEQILTVDFSATFLMSEMASPLAKDPASSPSAVSIFSFPTRETLRR